MKRVTRALKLNKAISISEDNNSSSEEEEAEQTENTIEEEVELEKIELDNLVLNNKMSRKGLQLAVSLLKSFSGDKDNLEEFIDC
ncbi:unnamed protein product, partial [Diamesa tonsa]